MALGVGALFFLELQSNGTNNGSDTDCPDGNQWIMSKFNQCIVTTLQWSSFIVGMASILCWVTVLMPQIYSDFKNISGVKSLSWGLLVCWFLGDFTNLTGSFLTQQGLFQQVLGIWFMITDVIIFGQMVYYHCCYKKKEKQKEEAAASPAVAPILCIMGLMSLAATRFYTLVDIDLPLEKSSARHGRTLLSTDLESTVPFFSDTKDITGFALGVFSAVAYTISRLFQINKNYKTRDVTGLDARTFYLCVLGNWLYGSAVVMYSINHEYLLEHSPWIYGSWGIMFLDSVILYQIKKYTNQFDTLLTHEVSVDPPDDEEAPLLSSAHNEYSSVSIQHH